MIYVIDHNDSFTHNVVHQFSLFDKVECDNYNQLNKDKLKKAIQKYLTDLKKKLKVEKRINLKLI